jgi:hypothetical protein
MRTLSSGFFSLVLLFCLSATLLAQTFRGGIQGTVTDATGAVVAGADVTVANPETGFSRATRTDATGNYFVSELPIGNYDVTVKGKGFRPSTTKGVRVEVSSNQEVNVQLSLGGVGETVVVTQ